MDRSRATTRGVLRCLRGAFVGVLTVVLGLGAHVTAGGAPPSFLVLALLVPATVALGIVLSRHRWTASTLLGVFLLAQAVLHVCAMGSEGPMSTSGMAASHAVAAVLLVAGVLRGESALVALVEHLVLRAARIQVGLLPFAHVVLAVIVQVLRGFAPERVVRGRAPPALA